MKTTNATVRPPDELQQLLERAADAEADSIMLEFVPEGLQITLQSGEVAEDWVETDKGLARALIAIMASAAGIGPTPTGTFVRKLQGKEVYIHVEEYDSFGEPAYRLSFIQPRKRRKI